MTEASPSRRRQPSGGIRGLGPKTKGDIHRKGPLEQCEERTGSVGEGRKVDYESSLGMRIGQDEEISTREADI